MTTNFPETDIETPTAPPTPLVKPDGRVPGGARRPDLNPTGFVHPDVVSDYNREIIEGHSSVDQPGAHEGLRKDSVTGHLIGIEQAPFASHPEVGAEYPKWITPHASRVNMTDNVGYQKTESGDFDTDNEIAGREAADQSKVKSEGDQLIVPRGSVVSVPGFEHHVRRHDGALMVLVHDEDEEKLAMGEASNAKRGWTAGSEPHRSEMFEQRVQPETKYQASLETTEQLDRDRHLVGEEKSVADQRDRSGPGLGGRSEADSKIGKEDWSTRSGPVNVHPDKPFGNQGQK